MRVPVCLRQTTGRTAERIACPIAGATTGRTTGPTAGPATDRAAPPATGRATRPIVPPVPGPAAARIARGTAGPAIGRATCPVVDGIAGPANRPTTGRTTGRTAGRGLGRTTEPTSGPTMGPTTPGRVLRNLRDPVRPIREIVHRRQTSTDDSGAPRSIRSTVLEEPRSQNATWIVTSSIVLRWSLSPLPPVGSATLTLPTANWKLVLRA